MSQETIKICAPYIQGYCDACEHCVAADLYNPDCCIANQKSGDDIAGIVACKKVDYCSSYRQKTQRMMSTRNYHSAARRNRQHDIRENARALAVRKASETTRASSGEQTQSRKPLAHNARKLG